MEHPCETCRFYSRAEDDCRNPDLTQCGRICTALMNFQLAYEHQAKAAYDISLLDDYPYCTR